jgi:hypothetical protein
MVIWLLLQVAIGWTIFIPESAGNTGGQQVASHVPEVPCTKCLWSVLHIFGSEFQSIWEAPDTSQDVHPFEICDAMNVSNTLLYP